MTTERELLAAQQRLDELAAESRVLQDGSRAMRQECNEAWVTCASAILFLLHLCLLSHAPSCATASCTITLKL